MIATSNPLSNSPAQRLADQIVEKRDLGLPIPVRDLVAEVADIRDVDLAESEELDAVLHGLNQSKARPTLLLNASRPPRRTRFTLGHEFGHLSIAAHIGTISCHPRHLQGSDDAVDRPVMEREADEFASRLLVPRRFISRLDHEDVEGMLHELERAEVSPEAGVYSLAAQLPPGFVFAIMNAAGSRVDRWAASFDTTSLGISRGSRLDESRLAQLTTSTGRTHHHGRPVWWGRVESEMQLSEPTDEWDAILDRLLTAAGMSTDRSPSGCRAKVLAVTASANSTLGSEDLPRLAQRVRLQLAKRPEFAALLDQPELKDFISARVRYFRTKRDTR